ncbi:MAG: glycosyltransferase [Planctomycetota bacterium]
MSADKDSEARASQATIKPQPINAEKKPRASIVIGVHNRWPALKDCLDSLRLMAFKPFEVVVVDDASTSSISEMVEEYRASHPELQIQLIRNEKNLGAAGARNRGVSIARGEFVCFTDSDCTVDEYWLTNLLKPLEDAEIGAVSGRVVDVQPRNWAERAHAGVSSYGRKSGNLIEGNMAIRHSIMESIGFDDALVYGGEGDDLAKRLKASGWRSAFEPQALVIHNHPMTISSYLRRGFHQGRGSARYWYKHDIFIGRDLASLALAALSLPLAALDSRLLILPLFFLALQLALLLFNELFFKGKRLGEALMVLPLVSAFYACRASGVFLTLGRILIGSERDIVDSKRSWKQSKV